MSEEGREGGELGENWGGWSVWGEKRGKEKTQLIKLINCKMGTKSILKNWVRAVCQIRHKRQSNIS